MYIYKYKFVPVSTTVCIMSSQLCKLDHYETPRHGTNKRTNTFTHIICS